MRYIIAALLLSISFTSAWAQGVVYVGDIDSIDRELLESPSLPAPLAKRPMSAQPMGQPMPYGYASPMQANRNVEQVQYTRAAKVKQSASKEESEKKSSFFSKMKPTWLFGEEKQMETPAQKDPFLAAQPRMSASPISTQTNYSNRVSNAAFDQRPKQAISSVPTPSNLASNQSNVKRTNNGARNGGIAMRPPSKPTGLLNHLGLVGESKASAPTKLASKPSANKRSFVPRNQAPTATSKVKSTTVATSISNPFMQSKRTEPMPSQAKPITKPRMAESQLSNSQPHFVTDKKTPSLSSTTDGVKGFGSSKPLEAAKPLDATKKSINSMAIASDGPMQPTSKVTESAEEFYFVSDDLAGNASSEAATLASEAQATVEVELPAMPVQEASLPVVSQPLVITPTNVAPINTAPTTEEQTLVEVAASTPALVSPTESFETVENSVEMTQLPTPKPFVEANSIKQSAPMVLPTQNPFAKRGPIADANKQPSERSRTLLSEAHSMAEYAASREEFSAIIQRCRYVLAIDDSQLAVNYANELAGWGLNKRGELLLDQGRNAEARVDFNDAINCDKNCWRAEHNLGVIKAQSGDYLIAKRHFDRTLQLNPEFAKAFANRAALLVQSSNYQGALVDYQRAIEVDPDLAMAHAGRGRVCHMLGNLEQALRHLDAAELLSPNDAMISQGRGDLLVDLGRYGQARQAYEQAIMLAPEQPNAYRNLAWMLATCPSDTFRNGEEALANAQLALELSNNPDDIALDTHAAALAAVGRFDEAIPMLKEAIEMAPKADAEVYTERLAMYEEGKAFTSVPVGLLKQATYISDKNLSDENQSSSMR